MDMGQLLAALLTELLHQTDLLGLTLGNLIMITAGCILLYLGIVKKYEPFLLVGIGFSCIVVNAGGSSLTNLGGLFYFAYQGVEQLILPPLIFMGVGAMTDFGPMIANPSLVILGAAAHLGIFVALIGANCLGFNLGEAASIGIIGGADGPTAIFTTARLAPEYLGPIAVAAYSYMALVPIIQPPIVKLMTTKHERRIRMGFKEEKPVSWTAKFLFPFMVVLFAGILAPISVPLIGALMFGNMLKVSGVCDSLSNAAQNELSNLVTLFLGITVGATMTAENILTFDVLKILALGAVAFVFDTVGGVLFAKIANLFLKKKINPMIGACGISAFPMSGRVIAKMALKEDPTNFIIQHAIGVNVAGQVASVVAGGLVLALIPALAK